MSRKSVTHCVAGRIQTRVTRLYRCANCPHRTPPLSFSSPPTPTPKHFCSSRAVPHHHSSVTQPSDADCTHLMYLNRAPREALSGGARQSLRRIPSSSSLTSTEIVRTLCRASISIVSPSRINAMGPARMKARKRFSVTCHHVDMSCARAAIQTQTRTTTQTDGRHLLPGRRG